MVVLTLDYERSHLPKREDAAFGLISGWNTQCRTRHHEFGRDYGDARSPAGWRLVRQFGLLLVPRPG